MHYSSEESLEKIAADISDCSNFSTIKNLILPSVTRAIGANSTVFVRVKQDEQKRLMFEDTHTLGLPEQTTREYTEHYYRYDPVMRRCFGDWQSEYRLLDIFSLSNVCDFRSFQRTKYFRDFLSPNDLQHMLLYLIRTDSDPSYRTIVGFHRHRGERAYSQKETQKARLIGQFLSICVNKLDLDYQLTDRNLAIGEFERENDGTGVVVFDDRYSIRYSNTLGRQALYSYLDIKSDADAAAGRVEEKLNSVLVDTVPDARGGRDTETLLSFGPNNVCVGGAQIGRVARSGRGDLFIFTSRHKKSGDRGVANLHDANITSREMEVVSRVTEGLSNRAIADSLSISVRTVENHLRSIYDKLDISSRAQLILAVNH